MEQKTEKVEQLRGLNRYHSIEDVSTQFQHELERAIKYLSGTMRHAERKKMSCGGVSHQTKLRIFVRTKIEVLSLLREDFCKDRIYSGKSEKFCQYLHHLMRFPRRA